MSAYNTAEELDELLRNHIADEARRYLRNGGKMGKLREKAGVSSGTLSRLVYGETRRPHLMTALRVASALGIKIEVYVDKTGRYRRQLKAAPNTVFASLH